MAFSKNEEMLFRELTALSGDLSQIADNLTRDYHERLEQQRAQETTERDPRAPVMGMMRLDPAPLLADLRFIQDRLLLLIQYIEDLKGGSRQ